jgi:hypothetical protein
VAEAARVATMPLQCVFTAKGNTSVLKNAVGSWEQLAGLKYDSSDGGDSAVVANIHVEVDCKNHDGHTVSYGVAVPPLVARKSK